MMSETQKILISIDKNEALSVINTLREGLGKKEHFEQTKETEGARKLLTLLDGNFTASTKGINFL